MVTHSACIFQTSAESNFSLKRSARVLLQGSRWRRGSRSSFLTLDWPHRQHLSADAQHPRVPPPLCNRRMKAIVLHFPVTMAWGEALSHAGTASVLRPAAEYISPRPWSCPLASEESGRRRWLQTRAERQYGNVNSYKLEGIKYKDWMGARAQRWFPCGGSSWIFSFLSVLHSCRLCSLQQLQHFSFIRKKNWAKAHEPSLLLLRPWYFN